MCNFWRIWIIIVLVATVSLRLYGQQEDFVIEQFTNRDGLSNSAVNCIFQDSYHELWIGTWDGLNRYDGKNFRVFNYNSNLQKDPMNIGNNIVQYITEDQERNIWVSTMEGISKYIRKEGRFRHYLNRKSRKNTVFGSEFQVVVDKSGNVFARIAGLGLTRYDKQLDSFVNCTLPGIHLPLRKILFDNHNRLWVLAESGMIRSFIKTGDNTFKSDAGFLNDATLYDNLFFANGKVLLSARDRMLYEVDENTLHAIPRIQTSVNTRSITFYNQTYFVALHGQGYKVYDKYFRPVAMHESMPPSLQGMKINDWCIGTEQLLWMATDGNGLIQIAPRRVVFAQIRSDFERAATSPVRAICRVDGDLWIGTKGSGIACLHDFNPERRTQDTWSYYTSHKELNDNAVYALELGSNGLVYIGTDGKGLSLYDRSSRSFIAWSNIEGHDSCPVFGSVYSISEDENGSIWLGTSQYGLLNLRFKRKSKDKIMVEFVRSYTYKDDGTGLANDVVYSVCHASYGRLWIACRYGGLSVLEKATGKIVSYKAFNHEESLSNNDVVTLYQDQKKRLWIGTSYGLNWTEEPESIVEGTKLKFHHINNLNGLPNNTIHAITEDHEGNIWLSTNKGLAKVHIGDTTVANYQETDGLQSNEFSDGAVWKDPDGRLYFGGIYGLNYFMPQQIQKNVEQPNLAVRGLRFAGKPPEKESEWIINDEKKEVPLFSVSRTDNFFETDLNAVVYAHGDKCEYAWRLVGYDRDWQYGGNLGKLSYSNIPAGKYTLLVKWSNGEGSWTLPKEAFLLHVRPYPWATPQAILLYFVIFAVSGRIFYSNRRRKLEIKHQLRLQQTLREKDIALHQEQLDFYTNVAHELQTPLTLIMGSAEQFQYHVAGGVSPGKQLSLVSMLHQQASRLTYLVHQLLEFRKASAGHLQCHYTQLDVSYLIRQLTKLFMPLSEQLKITYDCVIPDNVMVQMDKDKLEKILFNLVSNAFKYAGSREHVSVSLQWDQNQNLLHISVSNSGCKLKSEDLDTLFQQFYSSHRKYLSTFSTGIGLPFTKQLVFLLKGDISVTLEDGWISFFVQLPVPKENVDPLGGQQYVLDASDIYGKMTTTISENLTAVDFNKEAIVNTFADNDRKKILIVEDEAGIRQLLRDILSEDYIVYDVSDGHEAVDFIQKIIPDLILSDWMMPNMDGLALCDRVKNTVSTCHIPFVILSAKGTIDQQIEGYEVGADAYVAKPFHRNHLKIRIKNLLEQQDRLHQLFSQHESDTMIPLTGNPEHQKFLQDLITIIESHLDDPELTTVFLEQQLNLSKMQLYRKLKTLSNMTPAEFIKHIRLKQAANLLRSSSMTVSEIFFSTGFNNQSHFFREFKKQYQYSPNEYRSQFHINQ